MSGLLFSFGGCGDRDAWVHGDDQAVVTPVFGGFIVVFADQRGHGAG
jgi:hypothetical protein